MGSHIWDTESADTLLSGTSARVWQSVQSKNMLQERHGAYSTEFSILI